MAGIPTNKTDDDLVKRTLIENLKFATNNLISTDIVLLLEPINTIDINGFYLTTTSQALEIINDVGSNNLKLQYDIYHMQIMEGNLIRTIGKNLEFIHHFQIADNPGRNEPGTGEINYSNILKFICFESFSLSHMSSESINAIYLAFELLIARFLQKPAPLFKYINIY